MLPTPITATDAEAAVAAPRRDLRTTIVVLMILGFLVGGIGVVVSPADMFRLVGLTTEVKAQVIDVQQTDGRTRKAGPQYRVTVSWYTGDEEHIASDTFRTKGRPPAEGSRIPVQLAPFGSDISAMDASDSIALAVVFVGLTLLAWLVGLALIPARRRWGRLATHVLTGAPMLVVQVLSSAPAARKRPNRIGIAPPGSGPAHQQTAMLRTRKDRVEPTPGDVLAIWSLGPGRKVPAVARRESDGLWWALSGRTPTPF